MVAVAVEEDEGLLVVACQDDLGPGAHPQQAMEAVETLGDEGARVGQQLRIQQAEELRVGVVQASGRAGSVQLASSFYIG